MGWVVGIVAAAVTFLLVWIAVDFATHTYVDGEVGAAWAILGFVGAVATLLWLIAVALVWSGRDHR